MASLMVKFISESLVKTKFTYFPLFVLMRHSSQKKRAKPKFGTTKHRNLIASSFDSLAARGFLRSYKSYIPGNNVKEVVTGFCNQVLGLNFDQDSQLTIENKFVLLNKCFKELNHSVPNSLLHKISCVRDIIEFYETPVSTTTPYDELKNQELPPNLHILYDYTRFEPDNDFKFKGISAFPRSSTIITGIKYKEKYKGHKAKSPYLDAEACAILNSTSLQ